MLLTITEDQIPVFEKQNYTIIKSFQVDLAEAPADESRVKEESSSIRRSPMASDTVIKFVPLATMSVPKGNPGTYYSTLQRCFDQAGVTSMTRERLLNLLVLRIPQVSRASLSTVISNMCYTYGALEKLEVATEEEIAKARTRRDLFSADFQGRPPVNQPLLTN